MRPLAAIFLHRHSRFPALIHCAVLLLCAALAGTDEQVLAILSTDGLLRETVKLLTAYTGNTVEIVQHAATLVPAIQLLVHLV